MIFCHISDIAMGRYYVEPDQVAKKEEKVFNITQDVIRKVKRKQEYKPDNLTGNVYKKKKKGKKGSDPFPGKKPVDPVALERHNRGEGVNTEKVFPVTVHISAGCTQILENHRKSSKTINNLK